jgi:quinol monooxygenase YgiN
VVVVAVLTPREGRLPDLLSALTEVTPEIHREAGCELYAVHSDDEVCVMVERWASRAALAAHADGPVMQRLRTLWADSLREPFDAWVVRNVPVGDPGKGTVALS